MRIFTKLLAFPVNFRTGIVPVVLIIAYVCVHVLIYGWCFPPLSSKFAVHPLVGVKSHQPINDLETLRVAMGNLGIANFHLLHRPTCRGQIVSVMVLTSPQNFKLRNIIRSTWGKDGPVHFLLGLTDNAALQTRIDEEAASHQDLLQGSFVDSYRNLTYKTVMGLAWAQDACQANYLIKADDDSIVHVFNIERYLSSIMETRRRKSVQVPPAEIYCSSIEEAKVFRNKSEKWYVTKEEYANETYPTYCQGGIGIIFSKHAVRLLLNQMNNVQFIWLEDVYVTGLLREKAGVVPTQIDDDMLIFEPEDMDSIDVSQALLGPFELTEEELVEMWSILKQKSSEKSTPRLKIT